MAVVDVSNSDVASVEHGSDGSARVRAHAIGTTTAHIHGDTGVNVEIEVSSGIGVTVERFVVRLSGTAQCLIRRVMSLPMTQPCTSFQ